MHVNCKSEQFHIQGFNAVTAVRSCFTAFKHKYQITDSVYKNISLQSTFPWLKTPIQGRQDILGGVATEFQTIPTRYASQNALLPCTLLTARVLPEPVWAIPTTSLPLKARHQPVDWMVVGAVHFCSLSMCIM